MIRRQNEMATVDREKMRDGNGIIHFLHYFTQDELKGDCRLCSKITIQPGDSIGYHEHHNEEELYIILKGTGLVDDAGKPTEVFPGDVVLTRDGQGHSIKNSGDELLEFMAIILLYE